MSGTKHDSKKLSLGQFIWLGFNYTVGIAFVSNLATLSNFFVKDKDGKLQINTDSVGMHIIWIFILLGVVASICAFAFAKLARIHKSDNNGGPYMYARTAFGRFTGFFTAFMQYILLPFLVTAQIFNLLKAFFIENYSGGTPWDVDGPGSKLGHWSSLVLDCAGIVIYFLFAFVIFGGMKLFKRLSSITGVIKWVTSGFLIIGAIFLAATPNSAVSSGASASQNYHDWFNPSEIYHKNGFTGENFKLTMNTFAKAFTSCFFFFAGFETFATAGKNIEKPERNLGLGILIIMLISTVFYVGIILIFIAGISPSTDKYGFVQNINIGMWNYEGINKFKAFMYAGMVIMIISQMMLKANVSMQNALYGGSMVQPLSHEGYIPEKFKDLNKDNLPIKGSVLNFIVTGFVLVIWLIIPDIYEGVTKQPPIFSVSQLTEASSAVTLFVYSVVVASALKHAITKKIKLHIVEWILFVPVLLLLVVMFFDHYYELIASITKINSDQKTAVGAIIEIAFISIGAITGITIYFTYYKPKLKKRLSSPEGQKLQAELDDQFVLVNTFMFTSFMFGKTYREDMKLAVAAGVVDPHHIAFVGKKHLKEEFGVDKTKEGKRAERNKKE